MCTKLVSYYPTAAMYCADEPPPVFSLFCLCCCFLFLREFDICVVIYCSGNRTVIIVQEFIFADREQKAKKRKQH